MLEEDLEIAIKVVIVGNGAVGKSSLIQRYCKGVFTHEYKKTIGVDFLEREIEVENEIVRLMLWDTAGQEEFDSITKSYYRGAQVCVLTFSTVDKDSFDSIEKWKGKVEAECGPVVTVLVQNKIDLIDESTVANEDVEALVDRLKLKLFRTSVKENFNIDQVFEYLVKKFLQQRKKHVIETTERDASTSLASVFKSSLDTNLDKTGSNSASNSQPSGKTEQSFQIKPIKQRVSKRHRFC